MLSQAIPKKEINMRPYSYDLVHPYDRSIFDKICLTTKKLPEDETELGLGENDEKEPVILSCHILSRAISRVFSLKFKDGYFCFHWEHSWVISPHSHIIDVYPVATLGGPVMILYDLGTPHKILYQPLPTESIYGDRFNRPWFTEAVDIVEKFLRFNI